MMTRLKKWQETILAMDSQLNKLYELFGSIESPLIDCIHKLQEEYTTSVSSSIGDTEEWLMWYWLDNAMGAKKLQVSLLDRKLIVESLLDLRAVIYFRGCEL